MQHYKHPTSGEVRGYEKVTDGACLNDTLVAEALASGFVLMTDAEFEQFRNPPPSVLDQLAQLDAGSALTQRNLREIILRMVDALKAGHPIDLSSDPVVQKVSMAEAQAEPLRSQNV